MNECLSPQHDFAQLEKFINFIASDGNITFQTIDDTGKQRPELRRILHGATETILRTLFRLNQQGAGILAVVNATDGKGRKAENIIHVRAVFCDLDENGKEKLDRIIADDKHPPHAIIESSPGKYHVYWRVDSSVTLDQFTAIQKGLIEKYGADPLVCDLPRAMRVPGLLHNKKEPVLSQIIIMNEEMQPYSVADFAEEIALGFRLAN